MPFAVEMETKGGKRVRSIHEGEIVCVRPVDPNDPFLFLPRRGALAKQTGDDELTVEAPKTPTHFFHGTGVSRLRTPEGKLVFIPPANKPSK